MKEEIIPIIVGKIYIKDVFLNIVINSTSPDIEIAGMPIKKDNLAAVFLSIPENNADVRVTPDLETPGNNAKDWDIPNRITSFKSTSAKVFFLLPRNSAAANKIAIIIEMIAIENKFLKIESENFGQYNFMSKPKTKIGILDTKM